MSTITFAAGRAGTGKSRMLRHMVKELHAAGHNITVIVPEQFTFETERELSETLGHGVMGINVYSFTTLAMRVMREAGERRVFLSRQGRRMAIRKCISECESELTAFGGVCMRPGFADKCSDIFAMCKRFSVSPQELSRAACDAQEGSLLARKLHDLALLYGKTDEFISSRFTDGEDMLTLLCDILKDCKNGRQLSLCSQDIFIDGFDMLTEQIYSVTEALMDVCGSMLLTFRIDDSASCRDKDVFASEEKAYTRLMNAARDAGHEVKRISLPKKDAPWGELRTVDPALTFLEKQAFAYPYERYSGDAHCISLFAATSREREVEALTSMVLSAAMNDIRYRDMAVVASDMSIYQAPVGRAFTAAGIPYFTDAKQPLTAYGQPRALLHALSCVSAGFNASDMLALIKTGFAGVDAEDGELFENYITAHGTRGTAFLREFPEDAPEGAESVRRAVVEPVVKLRTELAAADCLGDKIRALYTYMDGLGMKAETERLIASLRAEGRLEEAEEYAQVFNKTVEMLEQLHGIMGDMRVKNSRFAEIVREGMDAYDIGAIPATGDQVLFGSVGRTRARSVRALFVIGASDGMFPSYAADDDVINDAELKKLGELGIKTWDSSMDKTSVRLMDVYGAITKPKERLALIYPLNAGGDPVMPAPVVDRIREVFGIQPMSDLAGEIMPMSAGSGIVPLAEGLRSLADTGRETSTTAELAAYYAKHSEYKARIDAVTDALTFDPSPQSIPREDAARLYGSRRVTSASRLETYGQCPFKHYARYGLKLLPRKEYREKSMDEGVFLHGLMEGFLRAIMASPESYTDEACEGIIDGVAAELMLTHNGGIFTHSARGRARAAYLVRQAKTTGKAIRAQLMAGGFRVEALEAEFGPDKLFPALEVELPGGEKAYVTGRIDRLDKAKSAELYRVIDYKKGGRQFSFGMIDAGLELQLPLYLAAITAAGRAGMYYAPIKEPVMPVGTQLIRKKLMSELRMNGVTVSDDEIIRISGGNDETDSPIQTGKNYTVSRSEMNELTKRAETRAAEALDGIYAGHARPRPAMKRRRSYCAFCDYQAVCCFDDRFDGCSCRRVTDMKKDDFFDKKCQTPELAAPEQN